MAICLCGGCNKNKVAYDISFVVNAKTLRKCLDCHNKDLILPDNMALKNEIISSYKRNAKICGRVWKIPTDAAISLIMSPCYYCGDPHSNIIKSATGARELKYNGIDRIDSSKGYTLDNVVSCCWPCNSLKKANIQEDFLNRIRLIYEYRIMK